MPKHWNLNILPKKKWVSFKTNVPDDFKKMLDLLNKLHS